MDARILIAMVVFVLAAAAIAVCRRHKSGGGGDSGDNASLLSAHDAKDSDPGASAGGDRGGSSNG